MINKKLKWTTSLTCMAKITIASKPASWFEIIVSFQKPRPRSRGEQALTTFARDLDTFYKLFFVSNKCIYIFICFKAI